MEAQYKKTANILALNRPAKFKRITFCSVFLTINYRTDLATPTLFYAFCFSLPIER